MGPEVGQLNAGKEKMSVLFGHANVCFAPTSGFKKLWKYCLDFLDSAIRLKLVGLSLFKN